MRSGESNSFAIPVAFLPFLFLDSEKREEKTRRGKGQRERRERGGNNMLDKFSFLRYVFF